MSDFNTQKDVLSYLLEDPLNFVKKEKTGIELSFYEGYLREKSGGVPQNFMFSFPQEWIKGKYSTWEDLLNNKELEGVWCYTSQTQGLKKSIHYVTSILEDFRKYKTSYYQQTYQYAIPVLCETLNKKLLNHPLFVRSSI